MMLNYKYCPHLECRWGSYTMYRMILIVSMLNEMSIVLGSTEIGHSAYFILVSFYTLTIIFVGIPLVYSQMCVAQYANCDVISMWNFCPLFRGFGYGLIFLILMKTIYLSTLSAWYLEYAFHAALDPPPWSSCDYFNTTRCMVKRINVTSFQHCIEALVFYHADCGLQTASSLFYMTEVSGNSTLEYPFSCFIPWKSIVAAMCIYLSIYLLSIKKQSLFQICIKIGMCYIIGVVLILYCIALAANGSWLSTVENITWVKYGFGRCSKSMVRALVMLGCGSGVLIHLTRDVPFRSPATITSINSSLLATAVCFIMGLVVFCGIKNMSFHHGEEKNIIEIGDDSNLYYVFGSVSEILSYYTDGLSLWAFIWFSSIFVCLFLNLWLYYDYFFDVLKCHVYENRKYRYVLRLLVMLLLYFLSWPFYCTDLFASLTDLIEILQLLTCLMFSMALYWFYGFNRHADDINFMIGVKSSYYWRTAWALNPLLVCVCFCGKFYSMSVLVYEESYESEGLHEPVHKIVLFALLAIYVLIVTGGTVIEVLKYYGEKKILHVLFPSKDWGPQDEILKKSRTMFIPEIMTREFLYRQVRIHGYRTAHLKNMPVERASADMDSDRDLPETAEWNALTST